MTESGDSSSSSDRATTENCGRDDTGAGGLTPLELLPPTDWLRRRVGELNGEPNASPGRKKSGERNDKRIEPDGSLERKRIGDGDALDSGDSARLPGGTGTPYSSLKRTSA